MSATEPSVKMGSPLGEHTPSRHPNPQLLYGAVSPGGKLRGPGTQRGTPASLTPPVVPHRARGTRLTTGGCTAGREWGSGDP